MSYSDIASVILNRVANANREFWACSAGEHRTGPESVLPCLYVDAERILSEMVKKEEQKREHVCMNICDGRRQCGTVSHSKRDSTCLEIH